MYSRNELRIATEFGCLFLPDFGLYMDLLSGVLELLVLSLTHWLTYTATGSYDVFADVDILFLFVFNIISYAIRNLNGSCPVSGT
jgi:hypothetical protein